MGCQFSRATARSEAKAIRQESRVGHRTAQDRTFEERLFFVVLTMPCLSEVFVPLKPSSLKGGGDVRDDLRQNSLALF